MQQIIVDFGTWTFLGFHIPLRIFGYGLMLVLGFVLAILIAQWRARRAGENPDHLAHCGLLALVGGIVGSRAAYIIQHWHEQFANAPHPLAAVVDVTSGGLIYYGGVILATVMVLGYLLIRRLPVRRYLDMLAVPLMIGLAFGRMGCLLNGCCYGGACREDWPLGIRFPVYSRPLLKLDGRANPYSQETVSPSPVYAWQLATRRVDPPDVLVNHRMRGDVRLNGEYQPRTWLHEPKYLHGALTADQTAAWANPDNEAAARRAFADLAGLDGTVNEQEFEQGRLAGKAPLAGSEHWDEAIFFDTDASGTLSFPELWNYFAWRRHRFDADGDGKLSPPERARANEVLQADELAVAKATWSLPVKPAQPLGILNALLLAALLTLFYRLRRREGQVFALLAILYPITRFVLESVRADNPHDILHGVFTHNQYTSMVLTTIGIVMWLALYLRPASAGPTAGRRHALAAAEAGGPRRKSK